MPGQTMIAPETLLTWIGAPDAPVLIDVCIDDDFALDPRLIPGAFRRPFGDVEALAPRLHDGEVVVICQKGLKLSQGAAALLRVHGVRAKALAGGMVGWTALGFPAIPADALPPQRIVAAERPDPGALAALWLILRFVNREAEILFVAPDAAPAVADRFGGAVAPVFDAAMIGWGLATPALRRLSAVLGGEATETPDLTTALAGLRALHPDDQSCLAASLPLFDALHRAFSDASAAGEGAAA